MRTRRSHFSVLSSRFVFRFGFGSTFVAVVLAFVWSLAAAAQQPASDGPQYVNTNHLVRPANYREWIFVGSGLGLTYEGDSGGGSTTFTNVFVNPSAYRGFMETGRWPNGSVFALEFRRSQTETPPNRSGRFQTDLIGFEVEVKDSRFPDGWAFYNFRGGNAASAPPLEGDDVARCVKCHTEQTAVERTFVQFYPTLLDVARKKGTVKPGF